MFVLLSPQEADFLSVICLFFPFLFRIYSILSSNCKNPQQQLRLKCGRDFDFQPKSLFVVICVSRFGDSCWHPWTLGGGLGGCKSDPSTIISIATLCRRRRTHTQRAGVFLFMRSSEMQLWLWRRCRGNNKRSRILWDCLTPTPRWGASPCSSKPWRKAALMLTQPETHIPFQSLSIQVCVFGRNCVGGRRWSGRLTQMTLVTFGNYSVLDICE